MSEAGKRSRAAAVAAMSALAVAALFTLGRALVELVWGINEIVESGEGHWSGDVTFWLVTVLPLPVLAALCMLAALPWAGRRATTTGRAAAFLVALAAIGLGWIALRGSAAAAEGSLVNVTLQDPLLWVPAGMLAGATVGAVVLSLLTLRERWRTPRPR